MLSSTKLADARELALTIAPELQAAPLYVIKLPHDESLAVRGVCHRGLLPAFRESLIAAGEWRGPGNLVAIAEGFDDDAESILGITLHEVAHLVPFAPITAAEPTTADVADASDLLAAIVASPPQPPTRCRWHGLPFIRTCCHLQYRAAARGIEIPYPAILIGSNYAMPPLVQFARALGNEPQVMLGKSFAEILSTPAPDSFNQLFRSE